MPLGLLGKAMSPPPPLWGSFKGSFQRTDFRFQKGYPLFFSTIGTIQKKIPKIFSKNTGKS